MASGDAREGSRGRGSTKGFWRGKRPGFFRGGGSAGHFRSDAVSSSLPGKAILLETVGPPGNDALPKDGRANQERFRPHWRRYLSIGDLDSGAFSFEKLRAASRYLASISGRSSADDANDEASTTDDLLVTKRFWLDWERMIRSEVIVSKWPSLARDLEEKPQTVMGIFGLARYEMLLKEIKARRNIPDHNGELGEQGSNLDVDNLLSSVPFVRARLVGHGKLTPMRDLKANLFGRLVTVRGTVIRVSNLKPLCTWLTCQCSKCLALMSVEQPQGVHSKLGACIAPKCRSQALIPLRSHPQTLTEDWQLIRLQETSLCSSEKGRVPRVVEVHLTAELCDSAVPGDVVQISGVLLTRSASQGQAGPSSSSSSSGRPAPGNSSSTTVHSLYVHAISLINNKVSPTNVRNNSCGEELNACGISFTLLDYTAIQEIHAFKGQLFKLLVASLCPSIYGNEMVKAGLLLGLFGGTIKFSAAKDKVPVRGDPHILVVGDPGLGKSQMLSSCVAVAPRGVMVTATGATSSGLTVTLVREGGEFSLEAGALVLADQGVCCIDEFDKMTGHHQALLEAMEQQSISIAKSGISCTLPARTAVLAAANPVGGHYNKAKTVAENLKMSPALLSRFDLIFIMIDKPNEELDMLLSDHIMNRHFDSRATSSLASSSSSFLRCRPAEEAPLTLTDRLRVTPQEEIDCVPHELMRKYIAYSRMYVFPKLTPGAAGVIKDFYLELRRNYHTSNSCPVTTRQLESLIRLTEARARVELREEATESDAADVVDIVKSCLIDTFSDEMGILDFSRSINGSGVSTKSRVTTFVSAVHKLSNRKPSNLFSTSELKTVMASVGVTSSSFYDFMSTLSNQGYFIKKSTGLYQLLSADF